jgi:hypothetical protein
MLALVLAGGLVQNPIVPPGVHIADPKERVWADGAEYGSGSGGGDANPWTTMSADVQGAAGGHAPWDAVLVVSHGSWLMAHGSRLTAHGPRPTAHGS